MEIRRRVAVDDLGRRLHIFGPKERNLPRGTFEVQGESWARGRVGYAHVKRQTFTGEDADLILRAEQYGAQAEI